MDIFQIIFILCNVIYICNSTKISYTEITACYYNSSTLDANKNNPRVIDVTPGCTVHLWCQYCEVKEDYYPKLWLYKPRGNEPLREITPAADTRGLTNKLVITPLHRLHIISFNDNNSGIYECKIPKIIKGNVFLYVLEGVINVDVTPKVGTSSQWQEYRRNYLDSFNKCFSMSGGEPFKSLRDKYNITFKAITVWDTWGECKEIDHQKGVRKRIGRCRLRAYFANNTFQNEQNEEADITSDSVTVPYLTDGYDIPCRSIHLNSIAPDISEILRYIPDFEAEVSCHVSKGTGYAKHKTMDKYKRKTTIQVAEDSHVTLLCSEVMPNSDVKWYKDEKLLNSVFRNNICKNEEEPHISVDTNNSLHILHISKNQEGNYSCLVNGKKVQEFEVTVVSKSKLLNQEFIRYSIYLGFVLSLTMTCYCAGVCVAWHRRSSFADPLNLNKKVIRDNYRSQREREKLLN